MRQVVVSRTIIFDALRHARGFFEACAPTTSTSADRRRCRSSWVAGLLPLQPGLPDPPTTDRGRGHPQCLLPALAGRVLLRQALRVINHHVEDCVSQARIAA